MRFRSALALAAVAALLAGCSDLPEPEIIRATEADPTPPAYDATLEPAAAVMAIVPAEATVLEVTDFDQVRFALGYGDLSSRTDPTVRARFWREAETRSPLLSRGLLRESGAPSSLGFTQDDVAWEARFSGPSGDGYVLRFHDDVAMRRVQSAARLTTGPLAGATVVPGAYIAAVGATREPTESWAAEPELTALVGQTSGATYVSRDCLSPEEALGDAGADLEALDPLGPFSVAFGGTLVTARLGADRADMFLRARLAATLPGTDPAFRRGYSDPVVADPAEGRIGFRLGDGPVAARLAQDRQLPFAVCAD